MTKVRHKEIELIYAKLREIKEDLEQVLEEEQSAYSNIPEEFQKTTKKAETEEIIDDLDDALSSLDDAIESLFNTL